MGNISIDGWGTMMNEKLPFQKEFKVFFEPGDIGGCLFKTPIGYCPNMALWCKYEKIENPQVPGQVMCWVSRWNLCAVHMPDDY